ncbi:MAG: hypothetical protein CK426_01155, partial [Legionella sp.]
MKADYLSFVMLFFSTIVCLMTDVSYAKINNRTWDLLDKETKEQCLSVESLNMPLEDIPSEQELQNTFICDVENSYYGLYAPINYNQARVCAYIEDNNHILAMIYANGYQVKRNIDLALHFICLIDGFPAEIAARVNALNKMRKGKSIEKFELCDYMASDHDALKCGEIKHRWIVNSFNKKEVILFKQLEALSFKYTQLRVDNELVRLNKDATIAQEDEKIRLTVEYTKLIFAMSICNLKEYSENNYLLVDKTLNSIYKEILLGEDGDLSFTVAGVKKTQRAWLRYKILIEKLGALRCPHINLFTWGTIVTKQRLKQLKAIRLEQKEIETGARERN